MKFKVIIAESIAEEGINLLRFDPNFEVIVLDKLEKDKLAEEMKTAHAVIVRSAVKITESLLTNAKNLRIVGRAGSGYDNIDAKSCTKRGIIVMIATGGNINGVVELTIGFLLSLIREIPKADASMKEGKWSKKDFMGSELKDKALGIIGLGNIGERVANICSFLGMKIIALVRDKTKPRKLGFKCKLVDSLNEMLPIVDFLTVHAPLTVETKGMIGEKELSLMKPTAYIINTARGEIINETALSNALKNGTIKGAAIDVYSEEPAGKEKFPFISLENVITLPHLAGSTNESQIRVSEIICKNIREGLKSALFIDAVNLPYLIPQNKARSYRPFIKLAEVLGKIAGQYYNQPIIGMEVLYRTAKLLDLKPILLSLYNHVFSYHDSDISLMNIEDYIKNQGISITLKHDKDTNQENSIALRITFKNNSELKLKGTYIGKIPKILEIQDILIEFIPVGNVLLIKSRNVPGLIGNLGKIMGDNSINIAELHMGRSPAGEKSWGALMIDQDVPEDVLEELRAIPGVISVHYLVFN